MISTAQYSVGTTPVQIVSDTIAAEEVHIHCAGTIYLGGADVTTSNGLKMDNGDKLTFFNHVGAMYVVAGAGNQSISVLVIER